MTFRFVVPGPPRAKAKKFTARGGRPRGYLDTQTRVFQEMVCRAAQAAKPLEWPSPYRGPVAVKFTAVFPRPAKFCRLSKKDDTKLLGGYTKGRIVYLSRPDIDNISKAILDGLKWANIIYDDTQVVSLDGSRRWYAAIGEEPHTEVVISTEITL